MTASGDFRVDVTNYFFETSLVEAANYHVNWAPKLLINGALIQGSLIFGTAVETICSTFEDGDKPDVCYKWEECSPICESDKDCVLWGTSEECAEYRSPSYSNPNEQFDDDYLFAELNNAPTGAPTEDAEISSWSP
ncbi:hypothetical protein IV203_000799 [Nitzschia inconspicua]|uniref:Uncharacterized protein n=1 Tax=Nitzschia inconspicua TaxID=303405 RepID=A0A9K3PR22_9STRA|nr:hypothetical protein IV203_000799 [Nitzschia inconspicua]